MAAWESAPLVTDTPTTDVPTVTVRPAWQAAPLADTSSRDIADQFIPASLRSQSVGMPSPNVPVGQSIDKPIAEDRAPGPVVQAAGSLATDPEQKRRIIAGQLFPNLKPVEAQARVFYGPNGRMAAVGLDGQPYYVDPDRPDISALRTFSPANLASNIGGLVGPSLPAAGGIGLGAAAGPTSLFVGPLAAGVGAAAGDVLRQHLAARLDPGIPGPQGAPPPPQPYNWRQTVGEAGGAATGQALGASILRIAAPNRLGLSATEIDKLRSPGFMAKVNQIYDASKAQGVDISPGQATALPSLLAKEDVLASGTAGSDNADIAATFYGGERSQLNQALQDYLAKVSPTSDKTDASLQFQQGIEDATNIVRQDANKAAKPAYDAARAGGQVMSPDLAQLADLPATKSALAEAAVDYQNRTGKVANLDAPDFELWDLTKRKLDEAVNKAKRDGDYSNADAIGSVRDRLRMNLDAAYPTYETARDLAAPGQRLAARLQSSLGPAGSGDETTRQITGGIFGPNGINPRAVAEARDAFTASGRADEWQAGIRSYLQDLIDTASAGEGGLNPGNLRKQIFGTGGNTRAALQAAMTPEQFQGLDNVLGTLEAVARSKGMNSLTAPRTVGREELLNSAGGTPGVRAVRGISNLMGPRLLYTVTDAGNSLADWMTTRNVSKFADRIFGNPDAGISAANSQKFLQQAARLSPGSRELITRIFEFLGQQLGGTDTVSGRQPTPGSIPAIPPAPRNQMAPLYGP